MSRIALQEVIDRTNLFRSFRDLPNLEIDTLTTDDANDLYQQIDCQMSPENLHCDGEISLAQARKKARALLSAADTLQSLGFAIPNDCYEIR